MPDELMVEVDFLDGPYAGQSFEVRCTERGRPLPCRVLRPPDDAMSGYRYGYTSLIETIAYVPYRRSTVHVGPQWVMLVKPPHWQADLLT